MYLGESSRSITYRSQRHFEDYHQVVAKLGRRKRPGTMQGPSRRPTAGWPTTSKTSTVATSLMTL